MRNFTALTLILSLSAASFGEITSLGAKSLYVHRDQLEFKPIWELVANFCMCRHLSFYPSDMIPKDKKLVIGVSEIDAPEYLFIVENTKDIQNSFQCGLDIAFYYFLDACLVS